MGKTSKIILIILGTLVVSVFLLIAGINIGKKASTSIFDTKYTQEDVKEDLDLFHEIKIDLSVSDLTINTTNDKTASISYIDFSRDQKKLYEITVTNTDGLLTIKDDKSPSKLKNSRPPTNKVVLNIPREFIIQGLTALINVGNITIKDQIIQKSDFQINVGNLNIETQESLEAFAYDLETDVGKITIDDQTSSGINSHIIKENDAATNQLKAMVNVGNIDVK